MHEQGLHDLASHILFPSSKEQKIILLVITTLNALTSRAIIAIPIAICACIQGLIGRKIYKYKR
jgi:hypothetical protein